MKHAAGTCNWHRVRIDRGEGLLGAWERHVIDLHGPKALIEVHTPGPIWLATAAEVREVLETTDGQPPRPPLAEDKNDGPPPTPETAA